MVGEMKRTITIPIIPEFIYNLLRRLKRKITKIEIQSFRIVNTDNFEIIGNIKPESWDEQVIAEVYHISEERRIKYYHPRQDVLLINEAIVVNSSDIVITNVGIVWDKFYMPTFSKQKLDDINFISCKGNIAELRRYSQKEYISGYVLSLLGTSSWAWAHFIEQDLPKLCYAAELGLLNNPITILIPIHRWKDTLDPNILEVISLITEKYPNTRLLHASRDVEYVCEHLLWMPTGAQCMSGSYFHSTFDTIMPERVKKALKDHIVNPLCKDIKVVKKRKIFLSRAGMQRGLLNNEEIENFFKSKGYEMVNCSTLSVKEKAELFSNAIEIAGPNGSAWSNCIFCKGAKGIMFSNLARADEVYQSTMASIGNVKVLNVTGQDDETHGTASNYYIPLSKVEETYKYWYPKEQ